MKKKGISLIVLVITIIIMIIISASIILRLSGNDLKGKATTAKNSSNIASAKQLVTTALAEWELETVNGYDEFSVYAEHKLIESGFKVTSKVEGEDKIDSFEITNTGELYLYPIIPEGFVASQIETEDEVSEGLVIYELNQGETAISTSEWSDTAGGNASYLDVQEERNQFVWIPVNDIKDLVRRDGYSDGALQDYVSSKIATEPYSYTSTKLETGEYVEYTKIKESIEKNGGFYIARYEAGTTIERTNKENGTSQDVLSKKDKFPYNNVAWGQAIGKTTGDIVISGLNQGKGAVELSRNMYKDSNSVVSTLCYGVQWDAVMNFMKDIKNTKGEVEHNYIENSTSMGWYDGKKHKTGIDINEEKLNMVKNIYDMAGNMYEWTMESYASSQRVMRGGDIYGKGNTHPASVRGKSGTMYGSTGNGFRVALYVK